MAPFTVFYVKSCVCIKTNVTTLMGSWYIYGELLHLDKCMTPVNVTTHRQCPNGELQNIWNRHWYVSISFRYQTVICVRIDIKVYTRNSCLKIHAIWRLYTTDRLLHLWCVLTLDEWSNSENIASTQRLYRTIKSWITHHTLPLISPQRMCLQEIKCMYREEMLLHLWWVDTLMVCCFTKPTAPVNVAAQHNCINGKVATCLDSQLISIDTN